MNDFGGGMLAFQRLEFAGLCVLYGFLIMLVLVGAITVARWARGRWRTRKDKGYNANKWGAF